jgi:uncharacterized membrane protein YgdD (TMEM256/DUF423 family)
VIQWVLFCFQLCARPPMTTLSLHRLPVSARIFGCLGALSACSSVVFSALFAHWPGFADGVPAAVQTALGQQQFHALGLLMVAVALAVWGESRWWWAAGVLMLVGLVLFSLNLYARHALGFDALRAAVPWGGTAWILAWLCLAAGFVRGRGSRSGSAQ